MMEIDSLELLEKFKYYRDKYHNLLNNVTFLRTQMLKEVDKMEGDERFEVTQWIESLRAAIKEYN